MPKLVLSIVNYNSWELLEKCLRSWEALGSRSEGANLFECQVYVIDNASTQPVPKRFLERHPYVELLLNGQNKGFGAAHNQVLNHIEADYYLVLNPDVEFVQGDLAECLQHMEQNPEIGLVTVKIVNNQGKHISLPSQIPHWTWFVQYYLGFQSSFKMITEDKAQYVGNCSGAFLLLSRSAIQATVGFDERFFMYAEDLDLNRRIAEASLKIWYNPSLVIKHVVGGSSAPGWKSGLKQMWRLQKSLKQYVDKHHALGVRCLFPVLQALGIVIRVPIWIVKQKIFV